MKSWKFHFETYGCKVNQHETGLLRAAWQNLGGIETASPEEADYICVNSCAITARAERDARNAIYRLKRKAPGAIVILTGCATQLFANFHPLKRDNYAMPDFRVPQCEKDRLLAGPQAVWQKNNRPALADAVLTSQSDRSRAIVKVQDGCRQNCTYCIVPQTRPILRSTNPQDVLEQCLTLAARGFGELIISGINLRQYGLDRPEYGDFWDLVEFLDREMAKEHKGRLRLRISSIEPAQLGEKALRVIAESRLLCPHLHLSLQHASPKILRQMGRGHYSTEDILEFTRKLGRYWPLYSLGADLLIGFPGEELQDLQELFAFIEESPLVYAHVFPYSPRPGTWAAARTEQVSKAVRVERAAQVRERIAQKKAGFITKLCALPYMTIAPESGSRNGLTRGMNEFYIPCFIEGGANGPGLMRAKATRPLGNGLLAERL